MNKTKDIESKMTKYERLSLCLAGIAIFMSTITAIWQTVENRTIQDTLSAEYMYYWVDGKIELNVILTNIGSEKVYVTDMQSGYVKNNYYTGGGIGGPYDFVEKPFEPGEQRRFVWMAINPRDYETEHDKLEKGYFIRLITSRGQEILLNGFSEKLKKTFEARLDK